MTAADGGVALRESPLPPLQQTVAAILLLAYCLPIIVTAIVAVLQIHPVSGHLEAPDSPDEFSILVLISSIAENSTSATNVIRQILLPLTTAVSANFLARRADSAALFWVLTIVATLAFIASLVCLYLFSPPGWSGSTINHTFFADLASSLAIYLAVLIGLKL